MAIFTKRAKRTGITFYYIRFQDEDGRRHVEQAGTTPTQAKNLLKVRRGEVAAGRYIDPRSAPKAAEGLTVEALFEKFIATYKARSGSADFYRQILKHPVAHLGKLPVTGLTPTAFDDYLRLRRLEVTKGKPLKVDKKTVMVGAGRRKVSEGSLRKTIIALGTMLRWGRARGLVTVDPLVNFVKPHEPGAGSARALTMEEEKKILDLLPPLERDLVTWCIYSGMRRSEALGVRWPAIDRVRGKVHVMAGKTDILRTVPLGMSRNLTDILDRHPRRTTTDLLFHEDDRSPLDVDKLNRLIKTAFKSAGVQRARGKLWNTFRATASSRLYARRVMPQVEAAVLGHSVAVAMRHYVEFSPAAFEGLDGIMDKTSGDGLPDGHQKDGVA